MTLPQGGQTPITEFLGDDAGAGGPFAILGLLHGITNDDQVIRACNRRLNQINRHRHRSTPDAGEVRLAVHAAASQLLDPNLRTELAQRWPEGTPVSVPKAWKPIKKTTSLPVGFIRNARLLIAASGGWNTTARKRLAHFARMNRVTALELVEALGTSRISKSTHSTSDQPQRLNQVQSERIELIGLPPERSLQWFAAYSVLIIMAASVLTTVVISPPGLFTDDSEAIHTQEATNADTQEEIAPGSHKLEGAGAEREEFAHYTAIAHELDQLVTRSVSDPTRSIDRLGVVYSQFVDSWTAFPVPALKRSALHISEIVSRASKSFESDEALNGLAALFACDPSEADPTKAMIRMAMIDVILSDPSVTNQIRERLSITVKRCTGDAPRPVFDVIESLTIIAGLKGVETKDDDPIWWSHWMRGINALTADDEHLKTRLVLSAMSARLRDASPSNDQWKQSVIELVNAVSWREGESARYWLLGQFADEEVNTQRLSALTEALAIHSGAQQIDAQMILNASSTFGQRQKLAQAYRTAWAVTKSTNDKSVLSNNELMELVNELRIRISITPVQLDEQQAIAASLELARLNTAAWQFARGDHELADASLKGAGQSLSSAATPEILKLDMNARDIEWAQNAMNVENANQLSLLFAQLVQDNGPGANGAHALVYLATLHADSEIRSIASAQIVRYKDQASVLIALDHMISSKRISTRLERLVLKIVSRSLPNRADDRWYGEVHRELLMLTAQAIARTTQTDLTIFQSELGVAYWARLTTAQASQELGSSVRQLYQELLEDVQATPHVSIGLDPVERIASVLAVHLARSTSSAHQFIAYQRAVCELNALRVDRDTLGVSVRLEALLGDLQTNLDNSKDVFGQITQVERCIAQIWVLHLEGTQP